MLISPADLNRYLTDVFVAAGTPDDIAAYVASSLVESNIAGVDSHGAMRAALYLNQIASGWIKPEVRPSLLKESANTAVVSANRGFGIHALGYAMDVAIGKAATNQVAVVGLVNCTHTGRLGQFVEQAAKQNMVAFIIGGGHQGQGRSVTPYGGAKRVMATNPYAIGLPGGRYGPVVIDIATSTTAEGKLQVYRAKHEPLPPGWIVDKDGRPSTDVEDFYRGGMLLPSAGHKGYGLAVVAEMLGRALLGDAHELNWLIIAFDIQSFRSSDQFAQISEDFLHELKDVPPAEGFSEVLIPGELEARSAKARAIEGIPIPDETWRRFVETAGRVGVTIDHERD